MITARVRICHLSLFVCLPLLASTMPEKTITFVTGNANKLHEFVSIMGPTINFKFVNKDVDLPEYQGEIDEICTRKCEDALKLLNTPVIVEDTSLCFNALGGLPGPYIKWFFQKIGSKGLCKMLSGFTDKSGYALCTIGYAEKPGEVKLFHGKTEGTIVEPRGASGFGWDQCFLPTGHEKTYAEMDDEKNQISHRHKAVLKLKNYFETLLPHQDDVTSAVESSLE